MKKLILAAAVICATAMSYGAVASWKFTALNVYDGTGSSATTAKIAAGTTIYFFDSALHSQKDVFDAWAKKDDVASMSAVSGNITTAGSIGLAGQKYGTQGGGNYTFFFAILDTDKVYISKEVTMAAGSSDADKVVGFGNQASASQGLPVKGFTSTSTGTWAGAVPEPTSGLLMMLGVGLMALRRRRA